MNNKLRRTFSQKVACPLLLLAAPCWAADPIPGKPSLDLQVGQMLLVGFRGMAVGTEVENLVCGLKAGGVIIFEKDVPSEMGPRNIESKEQLAKLTRDLQALAKKCGVPPLLIATDVEGGAVNRLKEKYGFNSIPSHAVLAATKRPEITKEEARKMGRVLKAMGINWNLAPVVDLNLNPDNPVIGKWGRSFSGDPLIVSTHAKAFISGLHEYGVLTALKHFPGHGSSTEDSHEGLVDITETAIPEKELIPYRNLVELGIVDAVMTAHVFNRKIDPDMPATLSSQTITGILRNDLGFEGVVLTEDIQMKGLTDKFDLGEAVVLAVKAGADMISISNNREIYDPGLPYRVAETLIKSVKEGGIDPERISLSYKRIQNLKKQLEATKSH